MSNKYLNYQPAMHSLPHFEMKQSTIKQSYYVQYSLHCADYLDEDSKSREIVWQSKCLDMRVSTVCAFFQFSSLKYYHVVIQESATD